MGIDAKGSEPSVYRIRVKGYLDQRWVNWFEGMAFSHEEDGTTSLTGPLVDQAALYGLLNGIRDLGLSLLSVQSIEPNTDRE